MTIFKQKDNKKTKNQCRYIGCWLGRMAWVPVLSFGLCMMLLLIVIGISAVS